MSENQPPLQDEIGRRITLVRQALPVLLIPVLVAVVTVVLLRLTVGDQFPPPPQAVPQPPAFPLIPIVALAVFFTALIVLIRLRRPTISALVLIGAWTLLTTLGVVRGGISANSPALLVIPICAAGLLLDGVASLSLAAMATLLVASLTWLDVNGLGPTPRLTTPALEAIEPYLHLAFWLGLFWTVAALTWLLTGNLQRALKQSRAQAEALSTLSAQLEVRVENQTTRLLEQERESATLAERARLARDIHDTLAQSLTGIVVQLGAARRALEAAPAAADEHLDLAQRLARESLAEARRSVWNLRSPALERADLADALRGFASHPLVSGASVRFALEGEPRPLPPDVESALLRVAQEALANVAKHGGASEARVTLAFAPSAVRLTVQDDGDGFPAAALKPVANPGPWGGFGLTGMRERLGGLGGSLELRNEGGAVVEARVQLEPSADKG